MEIYSKSSMGDLVISNEVLSSIAINAAKDVDGISSLYSKPVDVVSTLKQGSFRVMNPVRIMQDGENFSMSIYVNIAPGKKCRQVAADVQSAVKESVQNMTGKLVTKVNVIVAGIDFEEPVELKEPCETEE
ncbi:MAG: Asp23/Gls24 family envelope stress response protein [Clostridiales bacterium]|nr:Asp23/Gls24 family envelope stress response protein [Clostridiales bacterium]